MAFAARNLAYSIVLSAVECDNTASPDQWILAADATCTGTVKEYGPKPTADNLVLLKVALCKMIKNVGGECKDM